MTARPFALLGVSILLGASSVRADDGNPYSPSAPTPNESAPLTDHDEQVGLVSLAYHGTRVLPTLAVNGNTVTIGDDGGAALAVTPATETVPLFGIRHWFTRRIGLDVGLGLGFSSGSFTRHIPNPDPAKDRNEEGSRARTFLLASRIAVPISVHSGQHYNLMVIPDVAFGLSRATLPAFQKSTTGEDLDLRLTGLGLSGGARVAGEVTFGFLGVPQLSVQTAWGLEIESAQRVGRIGAAEATLSDLAVGSSTGTGPWRWLTGSFSLFYGF